MGSREALGEMRKRRFYALNSLEELDAPGEWYLDRPGKRLYFYPKKAIGQTVVILATMSEPLLKVKKCKVHKIHQSGHSYTVTLRVFFWNRQNRWKLLVARWPTLLRMESK